jgi:uncharacterized membrane protein YfcA
LETATVLVLLGAAAGGFVQGLSGFAFGLVSLAFWAWFVTPQLAGPMVVFGSLIGQMLSIGTVRHGFNVARVLPFLIGGTLGVPLGVATLRYLDPLIFKAAVGTLLSIYCPAMLFSRELPRITAGGSFADGVIGFIGGVMGGIGGLSGPVPTLWCALRGWDNDTQRAVFQSFNLAMQGLTFVLYAGSGVLTAEAWHVFLLITPAMLVPSLIGARLYKRFSAAAFRRLVLLLLSGSGFVLLGVSVPQLLS